MTGPDEPMRELGCAEVRELAPDVALGLLTGEDRAAALAHLQGCEACRAEVASLAMTADEVLVAAPEATPPAGFAAGVLARLELAQDRAGRAGGRGLPAAPAAATTARTAGRRAARWSGRRRASLAGLAAAAVVLVVAGILAVAGRTGPDPAETASADLRTGRGDVVGEASVRGDGDATLTIEVPDWEELVDAWGDDNPSGEYWLAIEQDDGTRSLHAVPADLDGWELTLDAPADGLASVAMIDAQGRVWCSATF